MSGRGTRRPRDLVFGGFLNRMATQEKRKRAKTLHVEGDTRREGLEG